MCPVRRSKPTSNQETQGCMNSNGVEICFPSCLVPWQVPQWELNCPAKLISTHVKVTDLEHLDQSDPVDSIFFLVLANVGNWIILTADYPTQIPENISCQWWMAKGLLLAVHKESRYSHLIFFRRRRGKRCYSADFVWWWWSDWGMCVTAAGYWLGLSNLVRVR